MIEHAVYAAMGAVLALVAIGLIVYFQARKVRASAQAETVVLSDGFEGAFRLVDNIGELNVAEGWTPWWDARSARPEYKRATTTLDPRRVRNGVAAQQWFNSYNKHTAGVYRKVVDLTPGQALTFEAWVQAFSSDKDDFSHSAGKYRMRIGIDPYGGTNPDSTDIVWHHEQGWAVEPYDAYQKLVCTAVAKSDRATLFVWGQAEWALKHNDAYLDDVRLTVGGTVPPVDPPVPSGDCDRRWAAFMGLVNDVDLAIGRFRETISTWEE